MASAKQKKKKKKNISAIIGKYKLKEHNINKKIKLKERYTS